MRSENASGEVTSQLSPEGEGSGEGAFHAEETGYPGNIRGVGVRLVGWRRAGERERNTD